MGELSRTLPRRAAYGRTTFRNMSCERTIGGDVRQNERGAQCLGRRSRSRITITHRGGLLGRRMGI
eukprot:2484318-Prymnesium_polylepis.1